MLCGKTFQKQIIAFDSVIFAALLMVFSGMDFSAMHLSNIVSGPYGQSIALLVVIAAAILALEIRESKYAGCLGAVFYISMAGFFGYVFLFGSSSHDTTAFLLLLISLANLGLFKKQLACRMPAQAAKTGKRKRNIIKK